jgi:hypothetical protein
VGSWFFISVTSKVRKSFAEMVAELLFELLVVSAFRPVGWIVSLPFPGNIPLIACPVIPWFPIGFICAAILSSLKFELLIAPFFASCHGRKVVR